MVSAKILLGGVLLAATITDIARRRIPNRLICAGLAGFTGLAAWSAFRGDAPWFLDRLAAGALAFFLHLVPYLCRGMGAGDVKLAGVMGLLMGWQDWLGYLNFYCLLLFATAAAMLTHRKNKRKTLPLAPLMAAAYFLYFLSVI